MTKRGKALAVLAVIIAAAIGGAAVWAVRDQAPDIDVTKSPGAMKLVGTVAAEEIPFYDGDIPFLQYLSRGSGLPLEQIGRAHV
jgi:hypothetical protein